MFKKLNLIWLPLALSIFGVYAIQRGFAVLNTSIPNMEIGMPMFFMTMSLAVLIGGYILDNFNARNVLLFATGLSAIGIALVPYTSLGFGLLFGCSAALMKIGPYSAPLKLIASKPALQISPQSSAKNFGGAVLILGVYGVMLNLGWVTTTTILSIFFVIVGIATYFMLPDDKIEGWRWDILKELLDDEKFWLICLYFFVMSGFYWMAVTQYKSALIAMGYSKAWSLNIIAISFIIAGFLRFVVSWIGDDVYLNIRDRMIRLRLPLMIVGTMGMALAVYLLKFNPLISLIIFTPMSAIHTPNYWAYCREQWGPKYISTVLGLGYFFMYLGAGVMYGKWM